VPLGITLAWRNLWRHPRRTWLTLGAIAFSNVLLVFMISLQVGMYGLMIDNSLKALTGHIQVQAADFIDDRKMRQVVPDARDLAARIDSETGLQTVTPRAEAFALVSSADRSYGVQLLGVVPGNEPAISSIPGLVDEGRWLEPGDGAGIVIGSVLARNLRVSTGDELTFIGSARDGSFAAAVAGVVGIFDSGITELDRGIAAVPLGFFDETFAMRGAAHRIVVTVPELDSVPGYVDDVRALLPAGEKLVVHDWYALQPGLRQAIQADIGSAFFMYAVLVVLVAFSVLNTQLMSVLERTREFGINLALGISPGRLGRIVMLEAGIMGLLGLAAGALLGGLLTAWLGVRGFAYPGMEELAASFNLPGRMHPRVTLLSLFSGPLVVFLFTLLASAWPALRLHLLEPVQAMRAA